MQHRRRHRDTCYFCNTSIGKACGLVKVPNSQGIFTADSPRLRKFSPHRPALSSGKCPLLARCAELPGRSLPSSPNSSLRAFPCGAGPAGAGGAGRPRHWRPGRCFPRPSLGWLRRGAAASPDIGRRRDRGRSPVPPLPRCPR